MRFAAAPVPVTANAAGKNRDISVWRGFKKRRFVALIRKTNRVCRVDVAVAVNNEGMQIERKIRGWSKDIRKTAVGRDTPNAPDIRRVMFLRAVDAAVFAQDERVRMFIA